MQLDHAAGSPVLPQAARAVRDLLGVVGSPEQAGAAGRRAAAMVEGSREAVAAAPDARCDEVVLTAAARKVTIWRSRGVPEDQARSSLRLSLGHGSTVADVDALVAVLPTVVERARGVGAR